tara:strand:- start:357 stop:779 length:423 start_codon:yes stop_codon:yes gene_type:complete
MTTPTFFRKHLGALRPSGPAAEELLGKIALAEDVQVEIKRPRNLRHHRKFWKLIDVIFPEQTAYATKEDLADALKVGVGHCDIVPAPNGKPFTRPKSIAFKAMDQQGFDEFYDRVIDVVVTRVIPNIDSDDLRQEVESFL